MSARVEVHRLKTTLDSTFERARTVTDLELQADLARYLCILVSSYLENATVAWLLQHTRDSSRPSVQGYVASKLSRFTNANSQKLISLLAPWDPAWRVDLEGFLVDETKDAVDSVVALRNSIAHGASVGVTLSRISSYYDEIEKVVRRVEGLCAT